MKQRSDLPADVIPAIARIEDATNAYVSALAFIVRDTARDPRFSETHLFAYLAQDLLQSAISLPLLAVEGMWSVARRELRFILEASTKQAVIQHQAYITPIQEKLVEFEGLLASPSISCKSQLSLSLLEESLRDQFLEEVGRLYGAGSNYVHLSPKQVRDRMASVKAGYTIGFEGATEASAATDIAVRTLAASLVLLLHGVPKYVAGDLLVESDGVSRDWFFAQSKFIASIDSNFDDKHERKADLHEVIRKRQSIVRF